MVNPDPAQRRVTGDRLLTVREVAHRLYVSRSMIYVLIARGELRAIHVGHALRFEPGEVERYIRERAEEQAVPRSTPPRPSQRKKPGD